MRPLALFVRGREVPRAVLCGAVVTLVAVVLSGRALEVPDIRYLTDYSVPIAAVVPVAHAVVLGTALFSPMAVLEEGAARLMRGYESLHVVLLTALGLVWTAVPLLAGLPGHVFASSVRNVVGFLGLAMIGARLFGSGLAWLLPLVTAGPTLLLGVGPDNTPEFWAWPIQPGGHLGATLAAAGLWVLGLAFFLLLGPRRSERDEAL
ncbi:hypothetical protein [Streptomyces alkaliterrae]|uniref:Uncharacterized protein n=1 Tax=Streptomyces alkaliterrae TaxID=2213162 RepID=A0A7W3ZRB3_9ACTN|nr:hypothetical protein [Streptomyces alkaliterrae]MBB1257904.1 hypothetical protein [Streptomyces alkaliterrae]